MDAVGADTARQIASVTGGGTMLLISSNVSLIEGKTYDGNNY